MSEKIPPPNGLLARRPTIGDTILFNGTDHVIGEMLDIPRKFTKGAKTIGFLKPEIRVHPIHLGRVRKRTSIYIGLAYEYA